MTLNRRQVAVGLASAIGGTILGLQLCAAQEKPIRIGVVTQLTGYAQIYGAANRLGAEIAAERINAEGGIGGRKIEIVVRDDKSTPDGTVSAYKDLSAEGIRFFLSGPISGLSAALAPLLKGTDNILMVSGSNVLSITHELYNPNVFRLQLTSIPVFSGLAKVMADNFPNVRDWIAITSDQQTNMDMVKIFNNTLKKTYAEKGVQITIHDPLLVKAGSNDFRSQISTLAGSPAVGFLNNLVGTDALTFYKQSKSFGLDQKFKAYADEGANLDAYKGIASAMPESVWTPIYWWPLEDKNSVAQEVYKRSVEKTGNSFPFAFVAIAHDSVLALATAIKSAGSDDTKAIIAAIENGKPMGAQGPVVFRKEDHTYMGEMVFLKFGPDPSSPQGLKALEVLRMPSAGYLEPATPGERYVIQ